MGRRFVVVPRYMAKPVTVQQVVTRDCENPGTDYMRTLLLVVLHLRILTDIFGVHVSDRHRGR